MIRRATLGKGLVLGLTVGLAGSCARPVIDDRTCPGLVAQMPAPAPVTVTVPGKTDPNALGAPRAARTVTLPASDTAMENAVATRVARMVAAQAGSVPRPAGQDAAPVPGDATPRSRTEPLGLMAPKPAQRRTVRINLLAMTIGGQYGAFSSGFLTGWAGNATDPRPAFNVVTGASAGGVIAPLAFAGAEFDPELKLNAGIGDADVIRKRPLLSLLGASSLFSTRPLQSRVEASVSPRLVERIAERWRAGNDVFVGATNLDRGTFDLFDIGAFSASAAPMATRQGCLVEAVLATSAIPALFPPRRINGDLYTDAGVRQAVFLRGVRDGVRTAERTLGVDVRVDAFLIVNGDLAVPEVQTGTGLLNITERSVELVTDEGMRASIRETVELAGREGWRLRGVRAPGVAELACPPDDAIFSTCMTQALFDAGRRMAATPRIDWLSAADLRRLAQAF